MNKNAIKSFAVWARRDLIERIARRAELYGITETQIIPATVDNVNGKVLSVAEKKQRSMLISKVNEKGYQQVIEEVAYTWFNRFIALRFMEVNDYLPSHIRLFSDENGDFHPAVLKEALTVEIDGLNRQKVVEYIESQKDEELYKYLIITQCNALNEILPRMFQKIEDYTELLLPDNLLREGSVIEQMITLIPEEDWTDQVQIIGWLYQYYNTEPKDLVFANLKKNIKITKENIPAATQIFTPDWIVRYMVENSLGRLWLEGHPNDELKSTWRYYLEEAEQEESVKTQLETIRREYASIKPEEIKVIDPCMGSGHILCYMFDVLVQIYEAYGYTARDAASSIVENNINGLDIDDRAAQLTYFAVMMKARQYDRRFFSRGIKPNVYAIVESNGINYDTIDYFTNGREDLKKEIQSVIEEMKDAKEYGSILQVKNVNFELLYSRIDEITEDVSLFRQSVLDDLIPLINVAYTLSQKYNVVVTNPPYMGSKGMSGKLQTFVQSYYPKSKSDLFAVFIERGTEMLKNNGYNAQVTMQAWMFLTAFDDFREKILAANHIVALSHMDNMVMGIAFGTSATIFRKGCNPLYRARYSYTEMSNINNMTGEPYCFPVENERLVATSIQTFEKIPRKPIAYWISEKNAQAYNKHEPLSYYADVKKGMSTADDNRFLRLWHEIGVDKFQMFVPFETAKWYHLNKGGSFRRWYGNNEYVVNWQNDGFEMKHFKNAVIRNEQYYFRDKALTWTYVTNYKLNVRYVGKSTFAAAGPCVFANEDTLMYLLGLLNTSVAQSYADNVGGETITYEVGEVSTIPVAINEQMKSLIIAVVRENIDLSKTDWDSFESSWDFATHPFVKYANSLWDATAIGATMSKFYGRDLPKDNSPIQLCYLLWQGECAERFTTLKTNEEELNRLFIDIYGLNDELSPEVADKDVTVRKADLGRDIRSFISYAVGCMFGRYSLDVDGIAYAGGEWDESKYSTFRADKDNVLPICDDEYFDDDIVGKFVKFVEAVYGKDTLEENLKFIADALGGKGSPREVIRSYFLNDFYADHLKVYQKCPIYWQFDSGKKNGFKCLIYMHRYQPDTIARIRTDYVHEQQARYDTQLELLEPQLLMASPAERVKLAKKVDKLKAQIHEIGVFEEKVHHLADQMIKIDLDDGVKVNYAKFEEILTKIK